MSDAGRPADALDTLAIARLIAAQFIGGTAVVIDEFESVGGEVTEVTESHLVLTGVGGTVTAGPKAGTAAVYQRYLMFLPASARREKVPGGYSLSWTSDEPGAGTVRLELSRPSPAKELTRMKTEFVLAVHWYTNQNGILMAHLAERLDVSELELARQLNYNGEELTLGVMAAICTALRIHHCHLMRDFHNFYPRS